MQQTDKTTAFWGDLPPQLAAELRAAAIHLKFGPGRHVFREADSYRGIFLVASGYFKWYKVEGEGNEAVIKIYGCGELAGLPPLFDPTPTARYIANLVTVREGELVFWPACTFRNLLKKYPDWFFTFNRYLTDTLKELAAAKTAVSLKPVRHRLEDYLVALGAGESWVNLPMPKRQIACALSTSAETFSRALASLKREGRLQTEQGLYRLT